MVTFSIIIPTYNRKKYLGTAIDSVINQTYGDFELIIVDDGSTDNTEEYIKQKYSDKRIKYFYQNNKGQNFARNLGIRNAKGKYISFLDSDDYWPTNKLDLTLKVFNKKEDVDIVYGDVMVVNEHGENLRKPSIKRYSGRITSKLLVENCIAMSSATVKKHHVDFIGGMDETLTVADDYSLWLRLSSICEFYYLNEILCYWRYSEGQISRDISKRLQSNLYIVNKFLEAYPDLLTDSEKKKALGELYCKRVRLLGNTGNYKQGIIELLKAFRYDCFSLLPWRALYRLIFPSKG